MDTELEEVFEVIKIKQIVRKRNLKFFEEISSPLEVANFARRFIGDDDREVFLVICLNAKLYATALHRCHVGYVNGVAISISNIFKTCILNNAASFIVVHNHPSLITTPSKEDLAITDRLFEAGKLLDIPLQDHIIINSMGDFFSIGAEHKGIRDYYEYR